MQAFTPKTQRGFSLIELMMTVTILAILLFIGSSLSRAWVDRGHVNDAMAVVKAAVLQAKSAALRNTNNQPNSYAAASVCYDSVTSSINVVRAAAYANNACMVLAENSPEQNYILKTMKLAQGIRLSIDEADFDCLAFNASGVLVNAVGVSATCANQENIKVVIEKNDEHAEVQIN